MDIAQLFLAGLLSFFVYLGGFMWNKAWRVSLPKTNTHSSKENAVVLISEESGICAKVISQSQEVDTANVISYLSIDSLEMGDKVASLYNRMLSLRIRPRCLNNVVDAVVMLHR